VRHFPDLPFGEITIEGTSIVKHCKRKIFKNRISSTQKREKENRNTQKKKHPKKDPMFCGESGL